MDKEQSQKLYSEIVERFPTYRGWELGCDFHTGAMFYTKEVGTKAVDYVDCFFTPEYHEGGLQALAVVDSWGEVVNDIQADLPFNVVTFDVREIVGNAFRMIDRYEDWMEKKMVLENEEKWCVELHCEQPKQVNSAYCQICTDAWVAEQEQSAFEGMGGIY